MMGRVQDKCPQTRYTGYIRYMYLTYACYMQSAHTTTTLLLLVDYYLLRLPVRSASLSVLGMMNPTGEDAEEYTYQPPKDI